MVGEQQMSGFVGMQNPKTDNEVLRGITMVIECLKIFNKDELIHCYYLCKNSVGVIGYYDFITESFLPLV